MPSREQGCYTTGVGEYDPITNVSTSEYQWQETNDTMIYPVVHLLAGKLVHVVAIHPLDVSRANWRPMPNPQ